MPRIKRLADAEKVLEAVEMSAEVQNLRQKRRDLLEQLGTLDDREQRILYQPQAELVEARADQGKCLTAWVEDGKGRYFRFRLIERGTAKPAWDRRAWLRKMCHTDQVWRWTLDYSHPDTTKNNDRVVMPLQEGEDEIIKEADKILGGVGWTLTDLVNE